MRVVRIEPTLESFRAVARELVVAGVRPEEIVWTTGEEMQLPIASVREEHATASAPPLAIPRSFVKLAGDVALHRDDARWSHLYRVLWRMLHENRNLLAIEIDDDVRRLDTMAKQVRRDEHKMHAFVRFRKVEGVEPERLVAWYEPDHRVVRRAAEFFRQRFASLEWSILTPDECAHWSEGRLHFTAGIDRDAAPQPDALEELWRTYYGAIFNPARIKTEAMKREMPLRFWRNLPETGAISQLLLAAPARVEQMVARRAPSASPYLPQRPWTLESLAAAAEKCQGCDIALCGTRAVSGRGSSEARLVLVGEQPGDEEDRAGLPFVGPAGAVLDRALVDAGIDRSTVYVTNAVKHFKYEQRERRRIHKTPDRLEVVACRPWLEAELELVAPRTVVCLGASAARALFGATFRLMEQRGEVVKTRWAPRTLATLHPAAILRAGDPATSLRLYQMLVSDLRMSDEQ